LFVFKLPFYFDLFIRFLKIFNCLIFTIGFYFDKNHVININLVTIQINLLIEDCFIITFLEFIAIFFVIKMIPL